MGKSGKKKENAPGVQPGYRRIDHVIGIVADLVIDGKVVKTEASSPSVLKMHREGKIVQAPVAKD